MPVMPPRPLVTSLAIIADALRYKGHPYVYGAWDCSGFVNHVLGQDLGLAIPGQAAGTYAGPPPHGPVVTDYAQWAGAQAVSTPQPGDLVLWPGAGTNGHMGFVAGPDRMISALNPSYGTAVTPIQGFGPAGVTIVYRRVTGVISTGPAPGAAPGAAGQVIGRLIGVGVLAVLAAAAVLAAVSVAVGAIAAGGAAAGVSRPSQPGR